MTWFSEKRAKAADVCIVTIDNNNNSNNNNNRLTWLWRTLRFSIRCQREHCRNQGKSFVVFSNQTVIYNGGTRLILPTVSIQMHFVPICSHAITPYERSRCHTRNKIVKVLAFPKDPWELTPSWLKGNKYWLNIFFKINLHYLNVILTNETKEM